MIENVQLLKNFCSLIKYGRVAVWVRDGLKSKDFRIDFTNQSNCDFLIELNEFQTNFERISNKFWTDLISDNLTPTCSWSQIEQIEFELIFIEFFEYFLSFRTNRIANFRIESYEFLTKTNLTPTLVWVNERHLKVMTWRCGKKCQIFTNLNDCFYLEKCVKFLLRGLSILFLDLNTNARTSIAKICHLIRLHLTFQALQLLKYCLISTTLHKISSISLYY